MLTNLQILNVAYFSFLFLNIAMDSFTQIVLGAACGEAVLGRKIGNKALLFGAIGGTIPDLDVIIGGLLFNNEIDAMLFHRGIMHSVLFSVLGAFVFGWLVYKFYNRGRRLNTTTQQDWIKLFFWSLFTHPILDCFTSYGTRLFAPFSDYRVAFNNISVVDPLYTMPFFICMIALMFYNRNQSKRRFWLKMGLGISSFYLMLTVGNKFYVDRVFETSLSEKGLEGNRFSTQPTIFNNLLWYGITETKDAYHLANYSVFDRSGKFSEWKTISKKRALSKEDYPDIADLAWFSKDYYIIEKLEDGTYLYKDFRYPMIATRKGEQSVFNLKLYRSVNRLDMKEFEPDMDDIGFSLNALWERLKGI